MPSYWSKDIKTYVEEKNKISQGISLPRFGIQELQGTETLNLSSFSNFTIVQKNFDVYIQKLVETVDNLTSLDVLFRSNLISYWTIAMILTDMLHIHVAI